MLSFEKEASKRQERKKRGSRERKEESLRTKGNREIQACRKLALEVKRLRGLDYFHHMGFISNWVDVGC